MRLRRCAVCWRYTLRTDKCPVCGGDLVNPHPPSRMLSESELRASEGVERG